MGRQQRARKSRAHAAAAHSGALHKQQQQVQAQAQAQADASAMGAAAVAAAFADADAAEELEPVDAERSGDETGEGEGEALSRGQRKRLKRRAAFLKKMGLVRRVAQEKAQSSKQRREGAFADIAELQAALFQADAPADAHQAANRSGEAAKGEGKKRQLSGKQRQKLAVRELGQLRAVQTHPSFQGDPFAAIQLHLQNTVVKANEATLAAASAKTKATTKGMDVE